MPRIRRIISLVLMVNISSLFMTIRVMAIPLSMNQSQSSATPLTNLSELLGEQDQPTLIQTELENSYSNQKSSTSIDEMNSAINIFKFSLLALVLGIIFWIVTSRRKTLLKSSDKSDQNQNDKRM